MKEARKKETVTFSPNLRAVDECANFWMRQAVLRLRREVWWCWQERGLHAAEGGAALPPFADKTSAALDQSRFWDEKQQFYLTDRTARYLTEQLDAPPPSPAPGARGSFAWAVDELRLGGAATFALALALTTAFDASMGSVIAACLNDPARTLPNLALAQKLWDNPDEILALADASHPLFRTGLVVRSLRHTHSYAETDWEAPLAVPSLVARQLLFPDASPPQGLVALAGKDGAGELSETALLVALRLSSAKEEGLRVVPVSGPKGVAWRETVAEVARAAGRTAVEFRGDAALLAHEAYLNSLATVCWLRDTCLYINDEQAPPAGGDGHHAESRALPAATIPAILFLAASERGHRAHIPAGVLLPGLKAAPFSYAERVAYWKQALGTKARGLDAVIAESSRRFRYERETIDAICAGLTALPRRIREAEFVAACRAELDQDIGELASRVRPRFDQEELILAHKQHLQFEEHVRAMNALTEVHYGWGTGKVWNEGGISVLFAGPPGTGKTMAAEILARRLGLPMYRIDLSQVVNKYIGETEKNLKQLFDAADVSDVILFFDEADSLFGKRTEVSDAHDRYANLEISYLLERMERFKGLAILATNRKKDLDEAFLRRLRYTIDFPLPGVDERRRIWRQVIPERADATDLDLDFLARQFQFTGGHIRSVVFNACLQCADGSTRAKGGARGRLTMRAVVVAVKREFDKMNRTLSLEQYGPYASIVEELEHMPAAAPNAEAPKGAGALKGAA
jgi:hypothetical protein